MFGQLPSCVSDVWAATLLFQPFGQLPVFHHGDFELSQSHAIVRYLASSHGLHGGDVKETATINMVYDAEEDLFTQFATVQYADSDDSFVSRPACTRAPLSTTVPLERPRVSTLA